MIKGSFSLPPNGSASAFKVFVNDKDATVEKALLELTRGEFELHLAGPLKGGDRVQVQHTAGDLSSEKSPARRVPGTPEIDGKLEDGAKAVSVIAIPGAASVFVVVTDSADKDRLQTKQAAVPAECSKESEKCKVKVSLSGPLNEGERVRVQEEGGPLSSASKVMAKAAAPYKATVTSIEAYYGSQKVKVYFEKFPDKVEKASIKVTTCWEEKERALTDDERKANFVEVALDRGLFCATEDQTRLEVVFSTQTKGDSMQSTDAKPYEILIPRLTVNPVLHEGDGLITGTANGGVGKVRIQVYSGWQLETLTQDEIEQERQKKQESLENVKERRSAQKTRLETELATLANDNPEKGRVEAALRVAKLPTLTERRLELEVRQLQDPAEIALPLVASSPAEQAAVARCRSGELVQESPEQDVKDGKFSITLDSRLNAGECVIAVAGFAQAPPVTPTKLLEQVVTSRVEVARSVILDWGRLRGYFSMGGAVSHYRDQFSQVDTFIGFTADARVGGELLETSGGGGPLQLKRFRWQANLFGDARVSVRLANTTPTAAGDGTAASAQKPAQPITSPRLRYSADQPGYILGGIHFPISFRGMDWRHGGEQYSFFFSPIFRFGGQTQSEETVAYRHLKVKPSSDPRTFDIYREETRGGLLPMWGYGVRFGLYKYELLASTKRLEKKPHQRQVANDPIGYLDLTWGKSAAYRSYRYAYVVDGKRSEAGSFQVVNDAKLTDVEISSTIHRRMQIEGRLKIPALPALIGVDFGLRTNAADYEPNQLRFVVAFRIDAQKALGRVFGDSVTKGK
ncbi:MAG: hypothetical protein U0Q16_20135 [Bryobacteraceae bacterium]